MKKKLLLIPLAILLAISLVAIGCPAEEEPPPPPPPPPPEEEEPPPPPEPETLLIGSLYGATGWASGGTKCQGEGAQLCAEWINEQGGITINGQPYLIELAEADTECTAEGAAAGATRLVYDEGVKYIVNSAMAHITVAAGSVTEPAGVLRSLCWNCGSEPELGPATPYTFVSHPSTLNYIVANIKYLSENHPEVKTIELMMQDDGSIAGLFPLCQAICADYGITVTEPTPVAQDIVDFVPITTKVVNRNPDSIGIVNGWPFIIGGILKAAREQGFEGPVTFTSMCACTDILEVAGPEASTNFFSGNFSYYDYPELTPMINEMGARLEEKFGYFLSYQLEGFQALWCLTQAMEAAQSLDPDEIRVAWEQMETIETIFGTGRLGGLETLGINHLLCCPIPIERLQDAEVSFAGWTDVFIP